MNKQIGSEVVAANMVAVAVAAAAFVGCRYLRCALSKEQFRFQFDFPHALCNLVHDK